MEAMKNVYKTFGRKSEGKGYRRYRRGWEGNIKMVLK